MIRIVIVVAALLIAATPIASASDDIDTAVAAALVERADQLFAKRDFRSAKTLYIEALERDPNGENAAAALAGLRRANKKLGVYNLEHGRPAPREAAPDGEVLDPYEGDGQASAEPALGPLDPYAGLATSEAPSDATGEVLDPYAEAKPGDSDGLDVADPYGADGPATADAVPAGDGDQAEPDARRVTDVPEPEPSEGTARWPKRELQGIGAGYGLFAGLTLAGADSDGAFIVGLGGLVLGGWGAGRLADRLELTGPQVQLINSGIGWGTATGSFFGHLISGSNTTSGEVFIPGTIGGVLGVGAGTLLARQVSASAGDIATVNSLGAYGLTYGLMAGVALDVFDDRAYAINALVGTAAGLGGGIYLASKTDLSRRRTLWIDAGAAAGLAVPWALLFPLIQDDDDENADLQITAVTSMVTMAGGAALAYYLTRNLDAEGADEAADDSGSLALVRRTTDGRWLWRVPAPVPIGDAALAPDAGRAFGVGLAGGRF